MTPEADELEALRTENAALRWRAALAEQQAARLAAQTEGPTAGATGPPLSRALPAGIGLTHPILDPVVAQHLTDVEVENAALKQRLLGPPPPPAGVPLQQVIESVSLAVALGEATLSDRTVGSLTIAAQALLVSVDGGGVSLQFPSPATPLPPGGFTTMKIDLGRTPSAPGQPDAPTLFRILLDKQALFGGGGWLATDQGKAIVAASTAALADAATWTFSDLLNTADTIATAEQGLASTLAARQPPPAGIAAFTSATAGLRSVVDALRAKSPSFVAGDLASLTAGLHATTVAASGVSL